MLNLDFEGRTMIRDIMAKYPDFFDRVFCNAAAGFLEYHMVP